MWSIPRGSLSLWFLVGLGHWEALIRDGKEEEFRVFILLAPSLLG